MCFSTTSPCRPAAGVDVIVCLRHRGPTTASMSSNYNRIPRRLAVRCRGAGRAGGRAREHRDGTAAPLTSYRSGSAPVPEHGNEQDLLWAGWGLWDNSPGSDLLVRFCPRSGPAGEECGSRALSGLLRGWLFPGRPGSGCPAALPTCPSPHPSARSGVVLGLRSLALAILRQGNYGA